MECSLRGLKNRWELLELLSTWMSEQECSPCSPTPRRAQFKLRETSRQWTVAMAALCATPSWFFQTKIPLPTIAATPKTQSSPFKCVTVMRNLGTTVRNHQSPSRRLKLVRQSEVKKTQPYIFFNVENLSTRIVHPRDALVSQTPSCPTLTTLWRWVLSVSIAASINFLPWLNNFAMAQTETLGQECENVSHYYNQASELKGEELKQKLHKIVAGHQSLSYAQVWNALKILDAADGETPETSPDIVEIYSLKRIPKLLAGRSAGWNREHLWPRSYGLMEGQPEFSDLHNLRPADVNVNSSRGNKYFGDCTVLETMHCLVPANHEAAPDTATDAKTWRPPSQVRGDIARALFYMEVRYGSEQPPGRFGLQLSDSPSADDLVQDWTGAQMNVNARMGLLSTLLQWNNMDPHSTSEALRNSRVCSLYQHNRNPFVDHPEYAASIWGASDVVNKSPVSEIVDDMPATRGPVHMQQQVNAWINEIHYNNKGRDQDEFVEVVAGPGYDKASLSLFLYDRQGKVYNIISLVDVGSFTYSQDGSEYIVYSATLPAGSIQNGPADGIALVQDQTELNRKVLQFLSYQGVLTATEGPAIGLVSTDIGVRERNNYPIGSSIGLTGSGGNYTDFKWTQFSRAASPGRLNPGQFITKKIQLSVGMEEEKRPPS